MDLSVDKSVSVQGIAFDAKAFLTVCQSRAADCNNQARARGEECRVAASELFDLFLRQQGKCAITGFTMEYEKGQTSGPLVPQLDHIIEVRRLFSGRASFLMGKNEQSNDAGEEGKAADIENLQWVCKFANGLKERFRQAGFPLEETCLRIAENAKAGFPIRSECHNLGLRGAQKFRKDFIRKELSESPGISAMQIHEKLVGTVGEACYEVILKTMRELGWQASEIRNWKERRLQVLKELAADGVIHCDSFREFLAKANEASGHHRGFSHNCWRQDAHSIGIVFARTSRRVVSSISNGDLAACLAHLRAAGDHGDTKQGLEFWCKSRQIPHNLFPNLLDQLMGLGAVYEYQERYYAALTRSESARLIGVSPNRLKKWGRSDWGDLLAGPPFIKKTKKGKTYYTRHDVAEFIQRRGKHPLDFSVAGQRPCCVDGGRLGGRPSTDCEKVLGKVC